jgi:hypothetical protein
VFFGLLLCSQLQYNQYSLSLLQLRHMDTNMLSKGIKWLINHVHVYFDDLDETLTCFPYMTLRHLSLKSDIPVRTCC